MAATPMADLLQLPMGERVALPVDADLRNEIDRRWADHIRNPAAAMPWEQVRGQLGLG